MWADPYISELKAGRTVSFRPRGNSMSPLIKDGDLVTVTPIDSYEALQSGDVVLCSVKGQQYLHLIKACSAGRFQIGNNRGRINGWIGRDQIYGRQTKATALKET